MWQGVERNDLKLMAWENWVDGNALCQEKYQGFFVGEGMISLFMLSVRC